MTSDKGQGTRDNPPNLPVTLDPPPLPPPPNRQLTHRLIHHGLLFAHTLNTFSFFSTASLHFSSLVFSFTLYQVTNTNHTLKNTIQTLQAAKLEREVTIDELRACVRQYQHTLRDQQQQQQQQPQGIAPIGTTPATTTPAATTTTTTASTTTSPPPTTDPDLALVPTPSRQAPVCQRCVRLEARLRSQKQHLIRMQQVSTLPLHTLPLVLPSHSLLSLTISIYVYTQKEVRSHRDALEHMQYRQSCDSTILQSIFGHKDKGYSEQHKDKGLNKVDNKDHESEKDQEPGLHEEKEEGKEEEKEETPSSGHPPLSTSQTSLSLSFTLSAMNDSTDFLRSPLQQRTECGTNTNTTQHRYSNSNNKNPRSSYPSESRRRRRGGGKEGDQGQGQGLEEREDDGDVDDDDMDDSDSNDNNDTMNEDNHNRVNNSHSHNSQSPINLTGASDTNHSHNSDSAQQSRLGELASKLDFLDGELRRRFALLILYSLPLFFYLFCMYSDIDVGFSLILS